MLVKIAPQVHHFLDGGRGLHWVSSPVGVNDVRQKAPGVVMGSGTEASAVPRSRELGGSGAAPGPPTSFPTRLPVCSSRCCLVGAALVVGRSWFWSRFSHPPVS